MTISSLLIFLAVVGFGLVHSLLASLAAKSLAQRWLGETAGRIYRLGYNFLGVLTLLPALALLQALRVSAAINRTSITMRFICGILLL